MHRKDESDMIGHRDIKGSNQHPKPILSIRPQTYPPVAHTRTGPPARMGMVVVDKGSVGCICEVCRGYVVRTLGLELGHHRARREHHVIPRLALPLGVVVAQVRPAQHEVPPGREDIATGFTHCKYVEMSDIRL